MSTGQLLLVILAVALFSTLIVSAYNSMANQSDMAYRTTYQNQAIYVVDAVFQQIESEYLGKIRNNFDAIHNGIHNETFGPMFIQGVEYRPTIQPAEWWSALQGGNPIAGPANFIRLSFQVDVIYNNHPNDILHLGTTGEAFTKILARY